jgi:hypothetical protein
MKNPFNVSIIGNRKSSTFFNISSNMIIKVFNISICRKHWIIQDYNSGGDVIQFDLSEKLQLHMSHFLVTFRFSSTWFSTGNFGIHS